MGDGAAAGVVVHRRDDGEGMQQLFVVLGIAKDGDDVVWGFVKRMLDGPAGRTCSKSDMQVMRFGVSVRRAGMIHVCDGGCRFSREEGRADYSTTAVEGGSYKVLTRMDGYPPPTWGRGRG